MQRPQPPTGRFRDTPFDRIVTEAYCFVLAFVFHDGNNHLRKAITLMVVLVWVVMELGSAFGYAHLPPEFFYLRAFVGLLVGRMWGIEFNNFAEMDLSGLAPTDDREEDDAE